MSRKFVKLLKSDSLENLELVTNAFIAGLPDEGKVLEFVGEVHQWYNPRTEEFGFYVQMEYATAIDEEPEMVPAPEGEVA